MCILDLLRETGVLCLEGAARKYRGGQVLYNLKAL